jgi:NAD(P)H-hydrate epimerase
VKFVYPEDMRKIDQTTIEQFKIPGIVLMENAAECVVKEVAAHDPQKIWVFCGPGNNGGDGLAVARKLHNKGRNVTVVQLSDPSQYSGDAKINWQAATKCGVVSELFHDQLMINEHDVVVDAIFGTGLTRDVTGIYRLAIECINQLRATIIAVDISSGIHGKTGQVMGIAIRASQTVVLHCPKAGNLLYPGRDYAGEITVCDISIPAKAHDWVSQGKTTFFYPSCYQKIMKQRQPDGHKGTFGKVVVIAGSQGMTGAACLTSMSALKSGAGVVKLAVPATVQSLVATKMTEVMTVALPATQNGQLDTMDEATITSLIASVDVLAIGPGLGENTQITENIRHILSRTELSIVVDADGLNALANDLTCLKQSTSVKIITPHLGEMARLTKQSLQTIANDPIGVAQQFAHEYGVVVVLKGASTVVVNGEGAVYINVTGNSGMATAGSGDTLTGIITGLLAQGYDPYNAARLGVFIHGKAGDWVAEKQGEHGVVASEILGAIGPVMRGLSK